jgi:hypothetical protein
MNFLVSGFPEYIVKQDLMSFFKRIGYFGIDYLVVPDRNGAQRLIDRRAVIDLLILGGSPAEDFNKRDQSMRHEYLEYGDFATHNLRKPSILIVENSFSGIMKEFGSRHPPNLTCYWTEFSSLPKRAIDEVIGGRNLDHSCIHK